MSQFQIFESILLFLPFVCAFFYLVVTIKGRSSPQKSSSFNSNLPKSYPLIGSFLEIYKHRNQFNQWYAEILTQSPTGTFVLHRALGGRLIVTANPLNVQHILKTQFSQYPKGEFSTTNLADILGSGIFNTDGDNWKFQRKIASHEFNTKSLRRFVETVVETELSDRLIPILSAAAEKNSILDLQDILQRFAFDNICKIAFGSDPGHLLPSLPQTDFGIAFDEATRISTERFPTLIPAIWKLKKLLNIGSEKLLKQAVLQVRGFAQNIVTEKKQELKEKKLLEDTDLLARILNSGYLNDDFVIDMVISFVVAGRDTTSAALTWFFWLVSCNPDVEKELLKEINSKLETLDYDEVKDMVYTHASLCESMRLYPPVPFNTKQAIADDILPDGTIVKKGMRVAYHPYSMGRMKTIWGEDWADFKPERWLKWDEVDQKWSFVARDAYMYPAFHAGPRICLGKDMAFLQMKMVVSGVLRRFRFVPAIEEGVQPVFISHLTSKMWNGFPVRIEIREPGL